MEKDNKYGKMDMSKFIVKTELSNIKKEKGQFSYDEKFISMKWSVPTGRDPFHPRKLTDPFMRLMNEYKQGAISEKGEKEAQETKEMTDDLGR